MFSKRNKVLHACVVVALLLAMPASAQVARVFLSGTGADTNDCSNALTPCRSLQGAVDQCPVKGEIIVLSSGGFGTASITKSLEINAPTGVVAFNARTITVNLAAATDMVAIRGLSMNGTQFGDAYGINFLNGGTLIVENSRIDGFATAGIRHWNTTQNHPALVVNNCEFRNGGHAGIVAEAGLGTLNVNDSRFVNNAYAGIEIFGTTYSTIKNCTITNNGRGVIANGITYTTAPFVLIDHCVIAHNSGATDSAGISAQQTNVGFGTVTVKVAKSSIYGNTTGLLTSAANAAIISYGNNKVWSNGTNGAFTSSVPED